MLKYIAGIVLCMNIGVNAFSPSYTDLFKEYIPDAFYEDADNLNGIEETIQYYVSIHPDLIYYYLSYLNERFVNKNNDPVTNYLNDLNNIKTSFLKKRSNWAEDQIQGIYSRVSSRLKRNKMSSVFDDLLEDIEVDIESPYVVQEIKLKEYFIYLYLTSDLNESFDELKSYSELNDSILISKVINYNNKFNNINSVPEDELIEKLEDIKKYWYVFDSEFLERTKTKLGLQPFELCVYAYNNQFNNPNNLIFSTSLVASNYNYSPFDGSYHFSDYPIPTFTEPISYNFPLKVTVNPIFNIGIGYKIALSDEIGFLSSVKGIISYIYFSEQIEKSNFNSSFYRFTYDVISGSERYDFVYEVSDINNYKNWIISLKLELPVFYFNRVFYFDAGILVDYNSFSFQVEVTKYNVHVFNNEEQIVGKEIIDIYNHDGNKLTFSPLITFNSRFSNLFNLRLAGSYRSGEPLATIGLELYF